MTDERLRMGLELQSSIKNYKEIIEAIKNGDIKVEYRTQYLCLSQVTKKSAAREALAAVYEAELEKVQQQYAEL